MQFCLEGSWSLVISAVGICGWRAWESPLVFGVFPGVLGVGRERNWYIREFFEFFLFFKSR